MSHTIERDWTTAAGLRAVCLLIHGMHRCGYVAVGADHPLHGVDYSAQTTVLPPLPDDEPMGKRGIIPLICAGSVEAASQRPDCYFDVHGGLTFSAGGGRYPAEGSGLWWFGFDCGHAGDGSLNDYIVRNGLNDGPVRDEEYVVAECESLARQLAAVAGGAS